MNSILVSIVWLSFFLGNLTKCDDEFEYNKEFTSVVDIAPSKLGFSSDIFFRLCGNTPLIPIRAEYYFNMVKIKNVEFRLRSTYRPVGGERRTASNALMATIKEMKNINHFLFTNFKCTKSIRELLADLSVFDKVTALTIQKYQPKTDEVVDFSEYFKNIRNLAVFDTHSKSVMNYKNQLKTITLKNSHYQDVQKIHFNFGILIAYNSAVLRKLNIYDAYAAPFLYYINLVQTIIEMLEELYIQHYSAQGDFAYYQLTKYTRNDNVGKEFVGKRTKLLVGNLLTFAKTLAKFELLEEIRIEHFDIKVFGAITREMLSFLKRFIVKHSELQHLNIRLMDDSDLMPTIWFLMHENIKNIDEFSLIESKGKNDKNDFIKKNVGIVRPFLHVFVESNKFYGFLPNEQHIQLTLLNANSDIVGKYAEWLSQLTAVKHLIVEDTNHFLLAEAFDKMWKYRNMAGVESKAWDQLETIRANFKASDFDSIQLLAHFRSLQRITLILSNEDDAKIVQKRGFLSLLWSEGVLDPDKPNIVQFTKIHQTLISNLN